MGFCARLACLDRWSQSQPTLVVLQRQLSTRTRASSLGSELSRSTRSSSRMEFVHLASLRLASQLRKDHTIAVQASTVLLDDPLLMRTTKPAFTLASTSQESMRRSCLDSGSTRLVLARASIPVMKCGCLGIS